MNKPATGSRPAQGRPCFKFVQSMGTLPCVKTASAVASTQKYTATILRAETRAMATQTRRVRLNLKTNFLIGLGLPVTVLRHFRDFVYVQRYILALSQTEYTASVVTGAFMLITGAASTRFVCYLFLGMDPSGRAGARSKCSMHSCSP